LGENVSSLDDSFLAQADIECAWCGNFIDFAFIEPERVDVPVMHAGYRCSECGNETIITGRAVTMRITSGKGRSSDQVALDEAEHQAKLRERLTSLRQDLGARKGRFSIFCNLKGHSWIIMARGKDSDGKTQYNGIKNTVALCRVCDKPHDDLKGEIGWIS
jgi:hypothetical protein